jgi:hypothetical protein
LNVKFCAQLLRPVPHIGQAEAFLHRLRSAGHATTVVFYFRNQIGWIKPKVDAEDRRCGMAQRVADRLLRNPE